MMQVTLKKAAALSLALGAIPLTVPLALNVSVYEDLEKLGDNLSRVVQERDAHLQRNMDIISAQYTIRQLLGHANAGKINDLLTERAMMERQLTMLNSITITKTTPNLSAIKKQIETIANSPTDSYRSAPNAVAISLENESVVAPLLKLCKKRKIQIDDELAKLNYSNVIVLPEEVVKVLTDLDLI